MYYVMSDIHGFYSKYLEMLETINFSDDDLLIVNGDVIDRGPDGIKIIQDIMSRKNVKMLMGNHELMFLETIFAQNDAEMIAAMQQQLWNGGRPTLEGFSNLSDDEQDKVADFLSNLDTDYTVAVGNKNFHIVHAFPAENPYDRVWYRPTRNEKSDLVPDDHQLIIGHSPVYLFHGNGEAEIESYIDTMVDNGEALKIEHAPNFICTDCACGQNIEGVSKLACLRLDDMQEFYI